MKVSDLCRVDAAYRRQRKAVTLTNTLRKRIAYYQQKHADKLLPHHSYAVERAIACLALDPIPACKINSSLSSRELITKPVKTIMAEIFDNLPEPTKRRYTPLEENLKTVMEQNGKTQRAAMYRALLMYEIAIRAHLGHFMIFNTLTVAPGNYYQVFSKDSKAFQHYLRAYTKQLPPHTDHSYFACLEEGSQHGRLHIHVIHFHDKLPHNAEDPNKGRAIPSRRELNALKALWPYGFSSPIMVRYSPQDAYGRLLYRWPYDLRTDAPYVVRSPLALASYMAKYITKTYQSPKRDKYKWRIRKSHSLGKTLLQELLSPLTAQDLLNLATASTTLSPKLNNNRIPPILLRIASLDDYNRRFTNGEFPSLATMGKNIQPNPSLLHSLHDSIQTSLANNLQNITATRITPTDAVDSFNETFTAIQNSARQLNAKYFQQPTGAYGTTSIKDHIY